MKTSSRLALGLTIVSLMLIVPIVFAAVPVPIGDTLQTAPFESNPGSYSGRTITNPLRAMDGDPFLTYATTTYGLATNNWQVTGFERPSDLGLTDFTIGWVTINIQYAAPTLSTADQYRWVYFVGAAGPFILQDWTGQTGTISIQYPSTDQLARSWGEVSDGGDGVWTWDEINSVVIRVEFNEVTAVDNKAFRIYEIWLTVNPEPKPPTSSPTISVQPSVVGPISPGNMFFVDIYAHDMIYQTTFGLQTLEMTLNFNVTSLIAEDQVAGEPVLYTHWPWIQKNWATVDNINGVISMSYIIPVPPRWGISSNRLWITRQLSSVQNLLHSQRPRRRRRRILLANVQRLQTHRPRRKIHLT